MSPARRLRPLVRHARLAAALGGGYVRLEFASTVWNPQYKAYNNFLKHLNYGFGSHTDETFKPLCWRCKVADVKAALAAYLVVQTRTTLRGIVRTDVLDREKKGKPEYIYVDDPLYEMKIKHEMDREKKRYMGFPRLWKSLKHSVAWRLLWLCRHGGREQRNMALLQLAAIRNIKEWDYRKLAQAMDPTTAVLLARTEGADLRYFLPPPVHIRRSADSSDYRAMRLCEMLLELKRAHPHACIDSFLAKHYANVQEQALETDILPKPDSLSERQLCLLALEAVHHHLSVFSERDDPQDVDAAPGRVLARLGALRLVSELLLRHRGDRDLELAALRVLSSLSVHTDLLPEFYQNGLIGHLSRWLRSADVRFQCGAAVGLVNLAGEGSYRSGIVLLHPVYRSSEPVKCDALLLHGLRGGVFVTWRQRDPKCESPLGIFGKKRAGGHLDTRNLTRDDSDSSDKDGGGGDASGGLGRRAEGSGRREESVSNSEERSCHQYKTLRASDSAYLADEDLRQVMEDQEIQEEEALLADYEVVMHDLPVRATRQSPHPAYTHGVNKCKRAALKQELEDRCSYTSCWPKDWLPRDCANLRIVGVNYLTSVSEWLGGCAQYSGALAERARGLRHALACAGVGERDTPLVWLAHSMGGLIVKRMLVDSSESASPEERGLAANTRAVLFYSTPHRGSALASMPRATAAVLWPSADVRQLREDSPVLLELQTAFLAAAERHSWETISFAESKPTLVSAFKVPLQFVHAESADLGAGHFYQLPLDHLSICKPATRQSLLYTTAVDVLRRASGQLRDANTHRPFMSGLLLRTLDGAEDETGGTVDEVRAGGDGRRWLEGFLLETFTDY